ncbi:peptidoglycan DD-metalloendopeptidase family protein [Demequina salsinemoris]|uniref:peptidoglycan DD-metalloendopeptidase family protein n=1 Tax=Demequina salsinemoris TaxID=577470 RepID=UPI000784EE75|nr:M23 family metallopeptidase [Demequina salsinemoris]
MTTRTPPRRLLSVLAALLATAIGGGLLVGSAAASAPTTVGASSYDDEIADAKKDQATNAEKLEELQSNLEDTDAAITEAAEKLQALEDKLPSLRKALTAAQEKYTAAQEAYDAALVEQQIVADKLAAAKSQEQALGDEISADEDRVAEISEALAVIARDSYSGSDISSLAVVLGASSSEDFVDDYAARDAAARVQANALAEMEEIAAVNRNREARQEAVREEIQRLKLEADELVVTTEAAKQTAQEAKQAAAAAKSEVEGAVAEQESITASLEAQRAAYLKQQKKVEAQQESVRSELRTLLTKAAAEEAAKAAAAKKKASSSSSSSATVGSSGSPLAFPTKVPYITSSYGMRYHPVLHYTRLHAGTDFRAYCGTPIYAAADGVVLWAKWRAGFGNQVMLNNGTYKGQTFATSYNHLTSSVVSAGDVVLQGDLLGYSGNTGTGTACHLHFEVYLNGSTVNPMSILPAIP